jgi:antitoxin component YwqK of YwqJK toxin-antitoxin module
MRNYLAFILLTVILGPVYCQSDTTTEYKGLKTKKFYSVSIHFQNKDGKSTYEVNGKKASKAKYDKYHSTWKNMETCCPCILKSYDENDVLLREAVSCQDCNVGSFKEFYPNGKVKLSGQYKENPTGDWKNIQNRGYCSVKEGIWTYFNQKGDTLYSEVWKNGAFIKQEPEQQTNEIWNVELTLNGQSVANTPLTPDQVNQLEITPKYKNKSKSDNKFTIDFRVSAIGYKASEKTFTLKNFKKINVLQMLSEAGIPSGKETIFSLYLLDNGQIISMFYLDVKH